MPNGDLISVSDIPCCPEISKEPCCERLRFSYRLTNRQNDIPVEIIIIAEMERCPGPLSLGDVVYSTTLLPGEKVRLFTSTRNTRFTYDSEGQLPARTGVRRNLLHEVDGPLCVRPDGDRPGVVAVLVAFGLRDRRRCLLCLDRICGGRQRQCRGRLQLAQRLVLHAGTVEPCPHLA